MGSLVHELQREALDNRVGVLDLLRKAYVVAVRLHLDSFRNWLELELDGYVGRNDSIPTYRTVGAILSIRHPIHGISTVDIKDVRIAELLSAVPLNAPLSEIEAVASGQHGPYIGLALSPGLTDQLRPAMSHAGELFLQIARTSHIRIVHAVRDAILKWTLELEKGGIIGEGMTFTSQEQKIAAEKEDEFARQINITIIGQMHNSSIQQASPRARQDHNG